MVATQSKLININESYHYQIKKTTLSGQKICLETPAATYQMTIGLPGEHQVINASLALAVIEELQGVFPVKKPEIINGCRQAHWPGRLEIVSRKPLIILDGAHNQASIEMLVAYLKKVMSPNQKLTIILGILADKDITGILKALNWRSYQEIIIIDNQNERAASPQKNTKDRQGNGFIGNCQ